MKTYIEIGERCVGQGHPAYIIAEMSANHNQDYDQAVDLIRAAKKAGADAIKLQTYTPDTLTIDCDNEYFRIGKGTVWADRNLYDLYGDAYTPWEWFPKLKGIANDLGLEFLSSAFDDSSVEFLDNLGVVAHKTASFEIVDIELIKKMARTGRPLIISTGMATLEEVEEAVSAAREGGANEIALLKCTSAYPALPEEMNLRTIPRLAEVFGVPVGLSDHSLDLPVAVAAVALGACIVEKHFTLSRSVPGPDSQFSLEPDEFKAMVQGIRLTEKALGVIEFGPSRQERASLMFRRSLFIVQDVMAGEKFTRQNVRSIRPGHGLPPKHLQEVLGQRAKVDLERGTPLAWEQIEKLQEM